MIELGEINDRQILYIKYDFETTWFKYFPKGNWLLFAITDRCLPEIFNEISRRAVDNDVVYVSSTGQQANSFHQAIDDVILIRDVENEYHPKWCILTTSHNDFEEEFWFAINSAFGETEEIKKIICIDITSTNQVDKLKDLILKMKTGWIP
ncbi:MAG: hypothetical protein V4667_10200 [Bacteroidota bacterium]